MTHSSRRTLVIAATVSVLGTVTPARSQTVEDSAAGDANGVGDARGALRPGATGKPIKALPCRPTIACTAEIVPGGAIELESGYLGRRARGDGGITHTEQSLLKVSLTDWLQLQSLSNYVWLRRPHEGSRYLDGITNGAKLVLAEQSATMPALSISGLFGMPTSSSPLREVSTYDTYGWAYASKDFGFVHADLNAGLDLLNLGGAVEFQPIVALSVSEDVGAGFGVLEELYAYDNLTRQRLDDGGFLFGVTYSPIDELVIDLGGDVGFAPSQRQGSAFLGFTYVDHHLVARR